MSRLQLVVAVVAVVGIVATVGAVGEDAQLVDRRLQHLLSCGRDDTRIFATLMLNDLVEARW